MGTWFDYTDTDKKIEAGRNRATAPAVPSPDKPGDKLAPQAKFTEKLRDRLDTSAALALGMRSTVDRGPMTGSLMNALAGNTSVPEEAQRKFAAAAAELHPWAYAAGQVAGAVPAAVDWGLTGIGAVRAGLGALNFGSKAPVVASGPIGAWTNASQTGKASYLARFANSNPIAASLATLGVGAGAGAVASNNAVTTPTKYDGFRFSDDPAMAEQQRKTLDVLRRQEAQSEGDGGAMVLNRVAAGAGGASPAQQYYAQIHTPNGKLREGITPEMEALARVAVQTEALMPGMQVAAPVGMVAGKNGGAVYVPGGEDAQKFWQNQYGEYDAAMAANKGQPVRLSDVLKAGAQGQPVGAGDTPAAVPGAFADIIDSYDGGGTMTPEQRQIAEGLAQRERQQIMDNRFVKLGQQLGINDPELAITMGRNGQFTKGMVDANILQQQVRTSTKLDPKEAVYGRQQAAIDLQAAQVKAMPEGPEKETAKAAVSRAQQILNQMVLTPSSYLGAATVNGTE